MVTPSPMDTTTIPVATSDLEIRISRIADPNIGMISLLPYLICQCLFKLILIPELRVKHVVSCEIREMLDTIRDSDSARALPYLVPALVGLLQSGEPAFQKDTVDYQFRRVLFEILNRLPVHESVKTHVNSIFNCMLHILRHDNEENGVTACKTLVDLVRSYRLLTDDCLKEFIAIFHEVFRHMKGHVEQYLAEDSVLLDTNTTLPALRSFKVLGEMGMVMVIMAQVHGPQVSSTIQGTTSQAFATLALESPAQNKARTDHEAMGGTWAGMALTIKNPSIYSDFIHGQIKVDAFLLHQRK